MLVVVAACSPVVVAAVLTVPYLTSEFCSFSEFGLLLMMDVAYQLASQVRTETW